MNHLISDTEQSDDDDAEERLDCVHDIHSQRQRQQGRTSLLKQQQYESQYSDDPDQCDDSQDIQMQHVPNQQQRVIEDFEDEYNNIGADVEMGDADEDIDDLVETERRA